MISDRTLRTAADAGRAWSTASRAEVQRCGIRDEAIRAAAEAGHTTRAIAAAVGISQPTVSQILTGSRGKRAAKAIRPNR